MANLSLRNVDETLLDNIKALTGKGTASQALLVAAELALTEQAWRKRLQEQLREQDTRMRHKDKLLKDLDGLCRQVLEKTGQTDLDDATVMKNLDAWIG